MPGSKLADNEKGLKWTKDDFQELRIMDANPSTGHPWHQYKYIRMKKNGNYLGSDGIYYQKGTIPNEDFQNLTHIPIDQVTDEWIIDFFN